MRAAGEGQERVLPADSTPVAKVITKVITRDVQITRASEIESRQRSVRASGGNS